MCVCVCPMVQCMVRMVCAVDYVVYNSLVLDDVVQCMVWGSMYDTLLYVWCMVIWCVFGVYGALVLVDMVQCMVVWCMCGVWYSGGGESLSPTGSHPLLSPST